MQRIKEKLLAAITSKNAKILALTLLGAAAAGEFFAPNFHPFFQLRQPEAHSILSFAGLSSEFLLLWTFNYAVIAAVGFSLLSLVPTYRAFSASERVPSGFFLGYITTLAVSRFWSCFTTGMVFYELSLLSLLSVIAASWVSRRKKVKPPRGLKTFSVFNLVFSIVVFAAALIQLVYETAFRWVGHGYEQYAHFMPEWDAGRFPILDIHYDEFIFHHFLTAPLFSGPPNPIIPWWITLALIKASTFSFILISAMALGLRRFPALLLTTFMFIGTVSILPNGYYILFDSSHPLLYTAHSGRVIGIPFLIFAFVLIAQSIRLPWWAMSLLGVGFVASTISNSAWLFVMIGVSVLPALAVTDLVQDGLISLWATPFLYLFMPAPPTEDLKAKALTALATYPKILILFLHCLWSGWSRSFKNKWKDLPHRILKNHLSPMLIAAVVSLLIFGNMLAMNPIARAFRHLVGALVGELQVHNLAPKDYSGLTGRVLEIFFDQRELHDYIHYNDNPYGFLVVYGAFLLLIGGCLYFLYQKRAQLKPDPELRFFCFFAFMTPLIFVFADFFGYGSRSWVRVRFFEVPFYLMIFLAGILLMREGSKRIQQATLAFLAIYTIAPFVFTHRIEQFIINFEFLQKLISSSL